MGSIQIGTCGFSTRQQEYFRLFSLIEIQKTFYQVPQLKTAQRWRHAAPDDFEFTLKALQAITHHGSSPTYRRTKLSDVQRAECGEFRDTKTVRDAWTRTLVRDQCRELGLVHVVDPFQQRPVHGTPRYFRMHGHGDVSAPRGYSHEYNDHELRDLWGRCTARMTYCLFNNVSMRQDAEHFRDLVQGQ